RGTACVGGAACVARHAAGSDIGGSSPQTPDESTTAEILPRDIQWRISINRWAVRRSCRLRWLKIFLRAGSSFSVRLLHQARKERNEGLGGLRQGWRRLRIRRILRRL